MSLKSSLCVVCVAILASHAYADLNIFSFTYDNISTSYDGNSTFTAIGTVGTTGQVERVVAPVGAAVFDNAVDLLSLDFAVTRLSETIYLGVGEFQLHDANGDSITGAVSGIWVYGGGYASFSGQIASVSLDDSLGDGFFDGTDHGFFDMDFSSYADEPYAGWLIDLSLEGGNWFEEGAFVQETSVQAQVNIVPEPIAVVMGALGLAAIAAVRIRRN